jgi:hypothetical protein
VLSAGARLPARPGNIRPRRLSATDRKHNEERGLGQVPNRVDRLDLIVSLFIGTALRTDRGLVVVDRVRANDNQLAFAASRDDDPTAIVSGVLRDDGTITWGNTVDWARDPTGEGIDVAPPDRLAVAAPSAGSLLEDQIGGT